MLEYPKTVEEAAKYRYGCWAGRPKGSAYDPTCCAFEAHDSGRGGLFYQCSRKPVAGPENLYCKQHAKRVEEQG